MKHFLDICNVSKQKEKLKAKSNTRIINTIVANIIYYMI